jgi:hypothetical protein
MVKNMHLFLFLSLLGASDAALAQEKIEAYSCRNGLFAAQEGHEFQLGQIKSPARAYFFNDIEGCPTGKGCQTKSYLIPGDPVIINQIQGDWACVWYQGKTRETVGWIPSKQIALKAKKTPEHKAWLGHWSYANTNSIMIKTSQSGKALSVDGQAYWFGLVVNGERVVHIGALGQPELLPQKDRLYYSSGDDEFSCKAVMQLLPPFLIADDNGNCGGQNVSFRGVYLRTNKPYKNNLR